LVLDVHGPDEFTGPLGHIASAHDLPLANASQKSENLSVSATPGRDSGGMEQAMRHWTSRFHGCKGALTRSIITNDSKVLTRSVQEHEHEPV